MHRKHLLKRWLMLLGILIGSVLAGPVLAQSSNITLNNLLIEVWPEYDRPEVLVIIRAELGADTTLPALVTFKLPGYIQEMHAVAVEQDNGLVDVNPQSVQFQPEGNMTLLTFAASTPQVHLEYYDPQILTKTDQTRQLVFEFVSPYQTAAAMVEVQEPRQATGFSALPAPTDNFTGADSLQYHNIELGALKTGDAIRVEAGYQRATDALSSAGTAPGGDTARLSGEVSTPPITDTGGLNLFGGSLGYILIGAGVVLLLGTGGYWWWSNARLKRQSGRRRPGRQPKTSPPPPPTRPTGAPAGFCPRCGTALRADSNFCHVCGAPRRTD